MVWFSERWDGSTPGQTFHEVPSSTLAAGREIWVSTGINVISTVARLLGVPASEITEQMIAHSTVSDCAVTLARTDTRRLVTFGWPIMINADNRNFRVRWMTNSTALHDAITTTANVNSEWNPTVASGNRQHLRRLISGIMHLPPEEMLP
jgi:hypothetical protein